MEVPASEMWYQMIMFQQNPAIKNFMICSQKKHQLSLEKAEQLDVEESQHVIFVYKAFDCREIMFTDTSLLHIKVARTQKTQRNFD